jgi:hypothetical protein
MALTIQSAAMAPTEVLDFTVSWSNVLDQESIEAITIASTGPVVIGAGAQAPSFTSSTTTFWATGVTAYSTVVITVQTTAGRTFVRQVVLTPA